ncbi:transposase [Synechococcus sp. WH 8101]|nr:transposase [Synechococcus sp. WH 8101]QNI45095.1 putative 3-methyladenine DNA glycosylase domain protein [Synechococcus sp. WH 8101]
MVSPHYRPFHGCRQLDVETYASATPIATTPIQDFSALPQSFFFRPAQAVAPALIGCLLVKRQVVGSLLWSSRMLKRLVEARGAHRSKRRRVSSGQQQLPFAFDCRLNQIPDEWHQIAVRFRRANGIRDGDRERSIW